MGTIIRGIAGERSCPSQYHPLFAVMNKAGPQPEDSSSYIGSEMTATPATPTEGRVASLFMELIPVHETQNHPRAHLPRAKTIWIGEGMNQFPGHLSFPKGPWCKPLVLVGLVEVRGAPSTSGCFQRNRTKKIGVTGIKSSHLSRTLSDL